MMSERDIARFSDAFQRVDVLPLGSGALAGVAYNIDRAFVAGFYLAHIGPQIRHVAPPRIP